MAKQVAAAGSLGERLARRPWLISAPWKAWPPLSDAQSHVDWKHRIDAHADAVREQLYDELLAMMGNHLRVNLVVACLGPKGLSRLVMRRIDILGKGHGLAHAHVIGTRAMMAAHKSCDALRAMAVRPQVVTPDMCMLDRIEIRDVVDQIHDIGVCWPSGDIGWFSSCGDAAVAYMSLAEHIQTLADMTAQGTWHQHYSDFSRSIQMRSTVAVMCGKPAILPQVLTHHAQGHQLRNGSDRDAAK
jgi:hypothetical protein